MPVAASVCWRAGPADAVDVGERDLHPLVAGEIDADETCHAVAFSLLVRGGLVRIRPRARSLGPRDSEGVAPALRPRVIASLVGAAHG